MAEKEDIKNLEKSNKSDFSQLNARLKQNNDEEDKRDKRRLDQATSHSQKNEQNLQALKGVVTSTESESTTKQLKSDGENAASASAAMAKIIAGAAKKKDKKETLQQRGQKIIGKMNFVKDNKKFDKLGNFIGNKIGDLGKSIVSMASTAKKGIIGGIGVLALFAFLQSDMFKAGVSFLVDFIAEFVDLLDPNGKTSLGLNKATAGLILALGLVALKLTSLVTGVGMVKLAVTGIQIAVGFLATGLGGLLSGLGALLIPLAIPIAIVAAIALVAAGLVMAFRDFQSTMEETGSVGEALKAGGAKFVGFILGFIPGLITKFIGFIAGLFGFDDFKAKMDAIDPVQLITDALIGMIDGIINFFAGAGSFISEGLDSIGRLFKAIGAGALAALLSPFSPIESFNKAFDEVMAGGQEDSKPNLGNIAAAGANMSGGEEDPARFVARKENEDMQMKRKEEMMGDKRAVTIVKNTVSKGGDNYSEVRGGDIHVHDHSANGFSTAN